MKSLFVMMAAMVLSVSLASNSFAHHYRGHHGGGRHGGGHHDRNDDWDDADSAIAASLGASLISLTLDAATDHYTAVIQQSEMEALAYDGHSQTSDTFQSAKEVFETTAGRSFTDREAAYLIVEYNQELRAQL